MTIDEFLYELKLCVPRSAWGMNRIGELRATYSTSEKAYCPITALPWWRDSEDYPTALWIGAARHLDMSYEDAAEIAAAADATKSHDVALRSKLLAATINK